jgi:integrin alpha FG-GAP repeat containing protein 1
VVQAFVSVPLVDLFPPSSSDPTPSLLVFDTTFNPPLPVPVRLGDSDLDGFPDALLVLVGGRGAQKTRTPKLVENVPCDAGVAGCGGREGQDGARGWKAVRKGVDAFERITDARGVSFLDMDEDVSFASS